MKYLINYFLLLSSFCVLANGANGYLEGFVTDATSSEDLAFAELLIFQEDKLVTGTTTAEDGFYQINLAVGRYKIQANYIGYQSAHELNVEIINNKSTILTLGLDIGIELPLVVITSLNIERCGGTCICHTTLSCGAIPEVTGELDDEPAQLKSANSIAVFPNPTTGVFQVAQQNEGIIPELAIIDSQGKTVAIQQNYNNQFNISEFINGTYYLVCQTNEGVQQTTKIVKIE